jgi:hypothetical protein
MVEDVWIFSIKNQFLIYFRIKTGIYKYLGLAKKQQKVQRIYFQLWNKPIQTGQLMLLLQMTLVLDHMLFVRSRYEREMSKIMANWFWLIWRGVKEHRIRRVTTDSEGWKVHRLIKGINCYI